MSILDAVGWFGLCCVLPIAVAALALWRMELSDEQHAIEEQVERDARQGLL